MWATYQGNNLLPGMGWVGEGGRGWWEEQILSLMSSPQLEGRFNIPMPVFFFSLEHDLFSLLDFSSVNLIS